MMRGLTVGGHWHKLLMALGALALGTSVAHAQAQAMQTVTLPEPGTGVVVECVANEILVQFEDTTTQADIERVCAAVGGTPIRRVYGCNVYVVRLPEGSDILGSIETAEPEAGVVLASVNHILNVAQVSSGPFTPDDLGYGITYAFPLCNVDDVWGAIADGQADPDNPVIGDRQVIVAVADSGIDMQHPDLADNIFVNPFEIPGDGEDNDGNGLVDDVNGWDFFNDDNDPSPETAGDPGQNNHGTEVSGCVGAVGNNAIGVAGMIWDVQLMPVKLFGEEIGTTEAIIVSGINYAAEMGADVINLSIGGPGTSVLTTQAVVAAFGSGPDVYGHNPDRNGVNIVAATGNESLNLDAIPYSPVQSESAENEIIGAAAVDAFVQSAVFTNYGKGTDIAAPGVACYTTAPGATYNSVDGTSFSCPYVAGFVALMRAIAPEMSAGEIRDIILAAADADRLYAVNPSYEADMSLGAGLLDGQMAALIVTEAPPRVEIVTPNVGDVLVNTTPLVKVQAEKAYTSAPNLRQLVLELDQERDPNSATFDVIAAGRESVIWVAEDPAVGQPAVTATEASYVVDPPLPVGDTGTSLHTLRIRVVDVGGRSVFFPPVGQDYRFRVSVQSVLAGPQMISFPVQLGAGGSNSGNLARPSVVLGTPVGRPGDTIVARWNPATAEYVRSDVVGEDDPFIRFFEPGKAYWVNAAADLGRLNVRGRDIEDELQFLDVTRSTASPAPLAAGWHQIGTPFAFPIALTSCLVETGSGELIPFEIAVTRGLVRGTIFEYLPDIQNHVPQTIPDAIMSPLAGYWLRTVEPIRLYLEPSPATVGVRSSSEVEPLTRIADGWAAKVAIHAGAYSDAYNAFGMAGSGSSGYDEGLDLEDPPALTNSLDLSFPHPEWGAGASNLSRDIQADGDRVEWPVLVRTSVSNADVSLTWGDLRSVPRDLSLYLVDSESGRTVSMRSVASYVFRSGDDGAAKLLTIRAERAGAGGAFNVDMLPTRVTRDGAATVSFRLSQPADVDCVVKNAAGRTVATVAAGKTMDSGLRSLVWDGRSSAGAAMPQGMYMVEITARNDRMEEARAVRTLTR